MSIQVPSTAPAQWFRFFAGRWLASTRGLKPSETGILVNLLAMMHERGGPLPENDPRLWRQCGAVTKAMFETARDTLISYRQVIRCDGGLWSDYMQSELEYRRDRTEIAKKNASYRGQKSEQNQQAEEAKATRVKREEVEVSEDRSLSGHSSTGGQRSTADVEDDARLTGASSIRSSIYRVGDQILVPSYGDCLVHDVLEGRGIVVAKVVRSQALIWTGLVNGNLAYICDAPDGPPRSAADLSRTRASA